MSEIRLFAISLVLAFLGSFGGAHVLTDLLAPDSQPVMDIVLLVVGAAVR